MKRKRYTTSFKEMVVKELVTKGNTLVPQVLRNPTCFTSGTTMWNKLENMLFPIPLTWGHMPNHLGLETGTKDSNRQTNKE